MSQLIIVQGDPVEGTDTHNISGTGTLGSSTVPLTGIGEFDYKGSMTDQLSELLFIDGAAAALQSSRSSLDPGEDSIGGHAPFNAKNIVSNVTPGSETVTSILETVGTGVPNPGSGSALLKVDGSPVLLDGDAIDSCDGLGATGNSTVSAQTQDWVNCSE